MITPTGREIVIMPVANGWVVYVPAKNESTPMGLDMDQIKTMAREMRKGDIDDLTNPEPVKPKVHPYDYLKTRTMTIHDTLASALDYITFTMNMP